MNREARLEAYIAECMKVIERYGWLCQGVFPTADSPGPRFTYTVGLTRWNHPELILFGVSHDVAQGMLNDLGGRVRDGAVLEVGQQLDDLIVGLPARLVQVDDTTEHFGMARRLYPVVRGLQVVWTDTTGRFPWDVGYDINPLVQPVLGPVPT